MRRPITLMAGHFGSRHFGTQPFLSEALRTTRATAPRALYVGAASADDHAFGTALCALIEAAGAQHVVWPKLCGRRRQRAAMRAALQEVEFVLVGGGDVETGMKVLQDADLIADLHATAMRGAVFAGLSAGSIMLGQRWIRWPRADAGDDEARTYGCLGLAPCSLDTHGEDDGWLETRSFVAVRARELGRKVKAYGVPSGGALVVTAGGKAQARGAPVPLFAARPSSPACIEATLAAASR